MLKDLIAQACSYPPGSRDRQRCIQQIHYEIMRSSQLWRESVPYYNDALQDTWVHCCQHLEDYDPSIASFMTWVNTNLRRMLNRYQYRQQRNRRRNSSEYVNEDGQLRDPVETAPARADIIPVIEMMEKTLEWVRTDPDGQLKSTYFRDRPDINMQSLPLLRLHSQLSWRAIAQKFKLSSAEAVVLPWRC